MTKLHNAKYRYGFTGTLDGTQTHKWVLEGLFGPSYKIIATKELIERISCTIRHQSASSKT